MAHIPYGYKIENGKALLDEERANKVKILYDAFLIYGTLTEAKNKSGIEKTHSVISKILRNEVYLGDDFYPVIIDKVTFDKVQSLRSESYKNRNFDNKKRRGSGRNNYIIRKVEIKFNDPYKQAEYVYGLIEEMKSNE